MKLSMKFLAPVVLAAALPLAAGCQAKKEPQAEKAPPENADIAVQVTDKGFQPSRIEVKKGSNATLVFTRVTDNTCAKDLVIAGNGAHLDLPLNQPVRIALGNVSTNIPFACGMGMFQGEVVAAEQ